MPRTVPWQVVLSNEEGWILLPSSEFEAIEPVYDQALFKMEGINVEGPVVEEQLDDFPRPEGCPSFSGSRGCAQEVPLFCLGGADIRVSMPPIWVEQHSEGVHKAAEISSGPPETSRNSPCDILG